MFRFCVAALFLSAFLAPAAGQIAPVATLTRECFANLETVLEGYKNPETTPADCDAACLVDCYDLLEEAFEKTTSIDCPKQDDIIKCMNYQSTEWIEFQKECKYFPIGACAPSAEGESESGGCGTAAEAEAAAGSAEAEAEAEAEAPEAEAAAPATEEEAEAPAPAAESEDGDSSRRRRALLAAEGESESEAAAGAGCFPAFPTDAAFEAYVKSTDFSQYDAEYATSSSNTAGIVLSVFFWVGLFGMGLYLKN